MPSGIVDFTQVVETPEDFQLALEANPAEKLFFETISNSNKKYYIANIKQARNPETRNRRIEKQLLTHPRMFQMVKRFIPRRISGNFRLISGKSLNSNCIYKPHSNKKPQHY